jgi:hypothetical protein
VNGVNLEVDGGGCCSERRVAHRPSGPPLVRRRRDRARAGAAGSQPRAHPRRPGRRCHRLGAHGLTWSSSWTGTSDTHVHSFESSFFVLEGEPVLYLTAAASGCARTRAAHSRRPAPRWRSDDRARWIEMASPRPRPPEQPPDTFFLGDAPDDPRPSSTSATPQPPPLPARRRRHGRRRRLCAGMRRRSRRCRRAWRRLPSSTAGSP